MNLKFSSMPALLSACVFAILGIGLIHIGAVDLGRDATGGVCAVIGGMFALIAFLIAVPTLDATNNHVAQKQKSPAKPKPSGANYRDTKLMQKLLLFLSATGALFAQTQTSWTAGTGNVTQTGGTYTATLQQSRSDSSLVSVDSVTITCSVPCTLTRYAFGTIASGILGKVASAVPVPVDFYVASSVGPGYQQGDVTPVNAGQTVTVCLSTNCGAQTQTTLANSGTRRTYSFVVSAINGVSDIAVAGRAVTQ